MPETLPEETITAICQCPRCQETFEKDVPYSQYFKYKRTADKAISNLFCDDCKAYFASRQVD